MSEKIIQWDDTEVRNLEVKCGCGGHKFPYIETLLICLVSVLGMTVLGLVVLNPPDKSEYRGCIASAYQATHHGMDLSDNLAYCDRLDKYDVNDDGQVDIRDLSVLAAEISSHSNGQTTLPQ